MLAGVECVNRAEPVGKPLEPGIPAPPRSGPPPRWRALLAAQEARWILRVRQPAGGFVGVERGQGVSSRREAFGERDGVLDRDVRALPVMREHRMRGVAEQDDPAAAPAAQRPRHEQPPAQVMANRVDHFDHRRMPAFEEGERVAGGRLDEPLFRMRPHVRRVDDSEEITWSAFGPMA